MSHTVYEGDGLQIDTFTGPAREGVPRTRIQLGVTDRDRGGWQILRMTLPQWAELCGAIRAIGGDPRETTAGG